MLQVEAEKLALQKILLSFEGAHGRPKERQERMTMRPLYDRYRNVKRLLHAIQVAYPDRRHPHQHGATSVRELLRRRTTAMSTSGIHGIEDDGFASDLVAQQTVTVAGAEPVQPPASAVSTMNRQSSNGAKSQVPNEWCKSHILLSSLCILVMQWHKCTSYHETFQRPKLEVKAYSGAFVRHDTIKNEVS